METETLGLSGEDCQTMDTNQDDSLLMLETSCKERSLSLAKGDDGLMDEQTEINLKRFPWRTFVFVGFFLLLGVVSIVNDSIQNPFRPFSISSIRFLLLSLTDLFGLRHHVVHGIPGQGIL